MKLPDADVPVTYLMLNPDTDLVKIGFSCNLPQRLTALRSQHKADIRVLSYRRGTGRHWLQQRSDAMDVEKDLHELFGFWRVEGEWFWPSPDIYEWFSA